MTLVRMGGAGRPQPTWGGRRTDALIGAVLGTLERGDHQRWANVYLRGLLCAPGRKTISRIAAQEGAAETAQSLHHFVSKSPWDWERMRAAAARWLEGEIAPRAWVADSLVIPKSGEHSVGVTKGFVPERGRVLSHQRAFGAWLSNGTVSVPVNWELLLGGPWGEDAERRRKAAVPEEAVAADPVGTVVGVVRALRDRWGLAPRPLVMDAGELPLAPLLAALQEQGLAFVVGVGPTTPVRGLAPVSPESGRAVGVGALLNRHRGLRTAVHWRTPSGARGASLALRVPVGLPDLPATGDTPALVAVGEWRSARDPDPRVWISNLAGAGTAAGVQLGRLAGPVAEEAATALVERGALDFEGRSYPGWHHHATLVGLAHAVDTLGAGGPFSRAEPAAPRSA